MDNSNCSAHLLSNAVPYNENNVQPCVLLAPTGHLFTGELDAESLPHGQGTESTKAGREVYTGTWNHGRWHGHGLWTNKQNVAFNGTWSEGKLVTMGVGHAAESAQNHVLLAVATHQAGTAWVGKIALESRHVYIGDLVDDLPCGRGIEFYPNGRRLFDGGWRDGRMHGTGTFVNKKGAIFEGEWANGKLLTGGMTGEVDHVPINMEALDAALAFNTVATDAGLGRSVVGNKAVAVRHGYNTYPPPRGAPPGGRWVTEKTCGVMTWCVFCFLCWPVVFCPIDDQQVYVAPNGRKYFE